MLSLSVLIQLLSFTQARGLDQEERKSNAERSRTKKVSRSPAYILLDNDDLCQPTLLLLQLPDLNTATRKPESKLKRTAVVNKTFLTAMMREQMAIKEVR